MDNLDYIDKYLNEVKDIIEKIDRRQIDKAIDILFDAWKADHHVFFFGNGGSASTATHFAADLSKTTIVVGKKRFKSISLCENVPLISAWINDEGWENVYIGQLENLFQPGDVVVAISVHGGSGKGSAGKWSQNLTKAMQHVRDKGGKVIGMAGFDGGSFKELADACIIVPKDSTPLVEGFHADIQHLIISRLREKVQGARENE
nr:SIS domain-containing protein [Candidatus Sigynarchaeum springense]